MRYSREKKCGLSSTIAGWCWLIVLLTILLGLCSRCQGATVPHQAMCRVTNKLGEFTNVGSGTLIDTSDAQGLVLTCAHLFAEGTGEILVEFPGAKSHGARLVDLDRDADLSAVVIANPANTSAAVEFDLNQSDQLSACGFGPQGEFRCATGPVVGEADSAGQRSILIGDAVRSGDSGGGVFDSQGRLVAVVWGEASGITYASSGPPLRRFLDRVLGRRTATVYACPNGMCPRAAPRVPAKTPSVGAPRPRQPQLPGVAVGRFDKLTERVTRLEQEKQDRGDYLTRDEINGFARIEHVDRLESENNDRHASLLQRVAELAKANSPRIAGTAARLLGISGPLGWGVIAVGSVGGWLLGRLWKRRGAGGRRDKTFRSK